jgi:Flp pilus assembly protein CpaB
MDIPYARRVARPTWLNARTVGGILLFSIAFLAGREVLEAQRATTLVWAAATDVPPDTVLGEDDLELVEAKLGSAQLSRYATEESSLEGMMVTRAIRAGELIPAEWLAAAGAAGADRTMTVPVAIEHANGGALEAGDRIDVFATFDAGDPRARTQMLLRAVEVREVVTAGGLVEDEAVVGVTVAVTDEEAGRLAFAIRTAEIDIARVVGSSGSGTPETVRSEDFE